MNCPECHQPVAKKPGRGRPLKRHPACQKVRKLAQKRAEQQKYRDAGKELERRWGTQVDEAMVLAAINSEPTEQHFIIDKPLGGARTPRGPAVGCSTRNRELAGLLAQKRQEAYEHPWWDEHPDWADDL